ncbi:MAG TPA: excinuclease ABC subunit UvrC [Kofleriaceae bacterium]|nr:excinuclease ABC subunit UvrC [Kofleriaceae bacterium]
MAGQFVPDAEFFERIPTAPGVYLMRNRAGQVIYVGKAKHLRNRVRQYFRPGDDTRDFVATGLLGLFLASVDTVVVNNEKEALLLENHLIKEHQPRFNVKLRDDKQYLVLRVDPRTRFPRVEAVRNIRDDGARYFGPYHSATSCRATLRLLNRHFQLRTCTDHVLANRTRPCLQYQIQRCPGPCVFPIDEAEYGLQVEDVMMFLDGKNDALVDRLRGRMEERAEREEFETAARLRDSIGAVEKALAQQNVVQEDFVDQDVFGLWREADVVEVVVLFIRSGKLVGRRAFREREQELPDAQVVAEAIQRYYDSGTVIPDEVVVPVELDDAELLGEWLSGLRSRKVRVMTPRRGQRARLVALADKNAAASAAAREGKADDTLAALAKLQARLGLKRLPRRIECFDIAHIQGASTVASMVTFVDGEAERSLYRKFKVKSATNDDFASMYEVLTRRFRRAAEAAQAAGKAELDSEDPDAQRSPWAAPDLLVIDGGKGQLSTALAALGDLGIELGRSDSMDVIGLAKEREDMGGRNHPDRVFLRHAKDPVVLRPNTTELFLLARVRDEAHRFANTFHRDRRRRSALRSALDDIPGIGAVRRRVLLRHFGSLRGIRQAAVDELTAVAGMSRSAAEAVRRFFDQAEAEASSSVAAPAGDRAGEPGDAGAGGAPGTSA